MTLDVEMITVDCADPGRLAGWWFKAVGGEVHAVSPGEFVMIVRQGGPTLGFERVPDPAPGKNGMHVDFRASDMDAEVARLCGLGATEIGRHSFGDHHWVEMADPEGNAFCVAGAPGGTAGE